MLLFYINKNVWDLFIGDSGLIGAICAIIGAVGTIITTIYAIKQKPEKNDNQNEKTQNKKTIEKIDSTNNNSADAKTMMNYRIIILFFIILIFLGVAIFLYFNRDNIFNLFVSNSDILSNSDVPITEDMITVPDLVGKTESEATAILSKYRLSYKVYYEQNKQIPVNEVIRQSPNAGEKVVEGTMIELCVCSETKKQCIYKYQQDVSDDSQNIFDDSYEVPNIVGMEEDEIYRYIPWYSIKYEQSQTVPEGHVIRTSPKAGKVVDYFTTVEIVVSTGNQYIHVTGIKLDADGGKTLDEPANGQCIFIVTASISPQNANEQGIIWTSSNSSVVGIEPDGHMCTLIAKGFGTSTITATTIDGNYSASGTVSVDKYIEEISIDMKKTYHIGEELEVYNVTVHYFDGSTDDITKKCNIEYFNSWSTGTKDIYVTYKGRTFYFTYEVIE